MSDTTGVGGVGVAGKAKADPFRLGWRYVKQQGPGGKVETLQVPLTADDVLHPQEGDFIVHTDAHHRDCAYLFAAFELALNGQPGIKLFADHRVDWGVEGLRPHGPDLAVFEGMEREWDPHRGTFYVAEFGVRPALVIEVTSPSTKTNDLDIKVVQYHRAGIPFYLIVDLRPEESAEGRPVVGLLGYCTTPQGYVRAPENEQGRVALPLAGLSVGIVDDRVAMFYADGTRVPEVRELNRELKKADAQAKELQGLTEEAVAARQQAERDAKKEADLRQQAEDRLALIEAELKRLRGEP